jgi:CheY-like chemotaxis protein
LFIDLHGPEAAEIIRKFGFTNKIIAVTGNTNASDVDAFLNAGADIVLKKPLKREKLTDVITEIINQRIAQMDP